MDKFQCTALVDSSPQGQCILVEGHAGAHVTPKPAKGGGYLRCLPATSCTRRLSLSRHTFRARRRRTEASRPTGSILVSRFYMPICILRGV